MPKTTLSKHALLSASGASRWLKCPPSARLTEHLPEIVKPYAEEGTLAHEMAELILKYNLNQIKKASYTRSLNKLKAHELYADEMLEYTSEFANFCHRLFLEAKKADPHAIIATETKVDYSEYAPEGFGTCDVYIVSDNSINIIDFKYGKGVEVSAEDNPQLKLYALGVLNEIGFLYGIEKLTLTVHQPRINNISHYEMTCDDLLNWANTEVKEKAVLAFDGAGEQVAGDHCKFCKLKPTCRKLAEDNLRLLKYDYKPANTLNNEEIADILKTAKRLTDWAKNVEAHALQKALQGEKFKGFKVVEGRSNRKYADVEAIEKILLQEGFTEDEIFKKELLGLTAMEKAVGKQRFNELLSSLIIKPTGEPTLVTYTDKRAEFNTAIEDFKEIDL